MQPKSVSASSLDNWFSCQELYASSNLEKVPEFGQKLKADVGTACHYALEHFVLLVLIKKTHSWDDLALLLRLYEEGFLKLFGHASKKDEDFKDGLALIKKWHKRTDLSGWTILSVEQMRQIPIADTGVLLTYIFDRIQTRTDPDTGLVILEVVDYKGLDRDTPIPTPDGWSTMGKLEEGDLVIGGDGKPCKVVHKSEIHYRDCYRISFDDGTSIVCDDEHRWAVRLGASTYKNAVMTPLQMLERGIKNGSGGRQNDIAVEHSAVQLPHRELPIDPYVFGAWIGDGAAAHGVIHKPFQPLWDEIKSRGYEYSSVHSGGEASGARTVYGLRGLLSKIGVLGNKHIPMEFLRSSYTQRLDLLRGIMDTDGHWNKKRKRAVLNTTNEGYAKQVYELVVSLGWTANIFKTIAYGFGKEWDAWQLWFTPTGEQVFLARVDPEYVAPVSRRPFRRIIKSIEKVESVPTQCIEVDSPDHCFLAGPQMVKTHNTINRNYSPGELEKHLQMRIYGLAAAIQAKREGLHYDELWVTLDLLRHEPVGIEITREQNEETWLELLQVVELIKATQREKARRTLGPKCKYCPVSASCKERARHIDAGGILGMDIDEMVKTYFELDSQMSAAEGLREKLGLMIQDHAQQMEKTRFVAGGHPVVISTGSRRGISDASRAAGIIGPELMKMLGKLNIGDVEKLLDSDQITEDQKKELRKLIVRNPTRQSLKIQPVPAIGGKK